MPSFTIATNISKDKIPVNFAKETCTLIARTLGKPEAYVVVHVNPDQILSWGGGDEPAATATLTSIGRLGVDLNKKHSAVLAEHIEKKLGISKSKMYIHFVDADKSVMGYNGTTFDDLL